MFNKGSDQTVRVRRLVWAIAGRTYLIVGNLMSPLKFCLAEISVTTEIKRHGDVILMNVKFCNKILKLKMPDSEAGPWACPKLSNYVTVQSDQVRNQLFF